MSQQINLFNPIFLKQKKYFSAVTMVQALGLILLGSLLISFYAGYQVSRLNKEAVYTTARLADSQARLSRAQNEFGPKQKSVALENDIAKLDAEVKGLQQIFSVLSAGDFGNTKGYSEYFRAFSRQRLEGLWLTGFSIIGAGNDIGLQGRVLRAELVPAYITRLKNEAVMQGKSFSTLEMHTPPVEPEAKDMASDKSAGKPKPAPYIDFDLHSAASVKESIDASGAKSK